MPLESVSRRLFRASGLCMYWIMSAHSGFVRDGTSKLVKTLVATISTGLAVSEDCYEEKHYETVLVERASSSTYQKAITDYMEGSKRNICEPASLQALD